MRILEIAWLIDNTPGGYSYPTRMAVVISTQKEAEEAGHFEEIGVVYQGDIIGTAEAEDLVVGYDLDDEDRIALAFNNFHVNASQVPDKAIDVAEYRERFS